jgi:hypothetical protein
MDTSRACSAFAGRPLHEATNRGKQDIKLKTVKKYYRIDRREIALLKFILEGYDGLAVMSTLDSSLGIISVMIAPGCEEEVEGVIQDLKGEILIEPIECPAGKG